MKVRNINNNSAVSPVIGTILMVVITVIIAAIVAVFAFGIGTPTKAPQVNLQFAADASTDTFSVTHSGGDPIVLTNEKVSMVYANDTSKYVTYGGTANTVNGLLLSDYLGSQALAPGQTLKNGTGYGIQNLSKNDIVKVMIMDVPSGQFIVNTQVSVT